jgi:hypothetical protein
MTKRQQVLACALTSRRLVPSNDIYHYSDHLAMPYPYSDFHCQPQSSPQFTTRRDYL